MTDDAPLRLMLVDDHPVVRKGLRAMLEAEPGITVAAEAGNGNEALALLRSVEVDVILLDLQMPELDGVDTLRRLTEEHPPALVLTTYDTDADILTALDAGARGYLLKDAAAADIAAAARRAARWERVLSAAVRDRLAKRSSDRDTALTSREIEILGLLATGLGNRDVARSLFISEATVKTHLIHIFTKLGVDNRTAAVATAAERGMLRSWGRGSGAGR